MRFYPFAMTLRHVGGNATCGIIARHSEGNPLTRLYFPGEIADHGECHVAAVQAHHVIHVLRLQTGAKLTLFDGRGVEYAAVIRRIDKSGLTLGITARREVSRESPLKAVLAQGISSGERMDYTVQKCVELGISAIQPLTTQRSVVRLTSERADKRVAHWQSVAASACEQCWPQSVACRPAGAAADAAGWAPNRMASVTFCRRTRKPALRDLPQPKGTVTLLVGPEGGWNEDETTAAGLAGFKPMTIGPRVLRTRDRRSCSPCSHAGVVGRFLVLWGDPA